MCRAFSYNKDQKQCIIPQKSSVRLDDLSLNELFRLRRPINVSSGKSSQCGVISNRIWQKGYHFFLFQDDCNFHGVDFEELHRKIPFNRCAAKCLLNSSCKYFSYRYDGNGTGTCHLSKNVSARVDRVQSAITTGSACGLILKRPNSPPEESSTEWNGTGQIRWRNDCVFLNSFDIDEKHDTATVEMCGSFCLDNPACTHFFLKRRSCTLLFDYESTRSIEIPTSTNEFKCGYVTTRIWQPQNTADQRILLDPIAPSHQQLTVAM